MPIAQAAVGSMHEQAVKHQRFEYLLCRRQCFFFLTDVCFVIFRLSHNILGDWWQHNNNNGNDDDKNEREW